MDTQKIDIVELERVVEEKRDHYYTLSDKALERTSIDYKFYNVPNLYTSRTWETIAAAQKAEAELKEAEQTLAQAKQQLKQKAIERDDPQPDIDPTPTRAQDNDVEKDPPDPADEEDDLGKHILDYLLKQHGKDNE